MAYLTSNGNDAVLPCIGSLYGAADACGNGLPQAIRNFQAKSEELFCTMPVIDNWCGFSRQIGDLQQCFDSIPGRLGKMRDLHIRRIADSSTVLSDPYLQDRFFSVGDDGSFDPKTGIKAACPADSFTFESHIAPNGKIFGIQIAVSICCGSVGFIFITKPGRQGLQTPRDNLSGNDFAPAASNGAKQGFDIAGKRFSIIIKIGDPGRFTMLPCRISRMARSCFFLNAIYEMRKLFRHFSHALRRIICRVVINDEQRKCFCGHRLMQKSFADLLENRSPVTGRYCYSDLRF